MQTECSAERSAFGRVEGRSVVAEFDGGALTSDAGGLLLGAADRRLDLVRRIARCFRDARDPRLVEHSVATLIGRRVFGIAARLRGSERSRRAFLTTRWWRCWRASSKLGATTARRSTAPAARWRTGSRNAKATCSPTEPRPQPCAPTSCGSGSPRSPMRSCALSGASVLPTPSSPKRPAARSGSSSSSSLVSSASARGASNSRSPQPVPTPTNGGWPPPASSQPPDASPRRRKTRQSNPQRTGDPQKTHPIRANRARDALVLATGTRNHRPVANDQIPHMRNAG